MLPIPLKEYMSDELADCPKQIFDQPSATKQQKPEQITKQAEDLFNRAAEQYKQHNWDKALQSLNQAKQLHELIPDGNNTIQYALTLQVIGEIQQDKKNYDKALNLY